MKASILRTTLLFFASMAVIAGGVIVIPELGEFKSRTGLIVARGTTIKSTIDGAVSYVAADVGSVIEEGAILASIENTRLDRSNLTELVHENNRVQDELEQNKQHLQNLLKLSKVYTEQATSYFDWYITDFAAQFEQTESRLDSALANESYSLAAKKRALSMADGAHLSSSQLETLQRDYEVSRNTVVELTSERNRIFAKLQVMKDRQQVLQSDGDTDYWTKLVNEVNREILQVRRYIVGLQSQLEKLESQIQSERERFDKNSREVHPSPYSGVINAVFASRGDLVTADTALMQILDCSQPIAVATVPEFKLGDFYIGQPATVKPSDGNVVYHGYVQHISSGPLLSQDTSIAAHPEIMRDGNKIIVAFDKKQNVVEQGNCDAARRAEVTIDTESAIQRFISKLGYKPETLTQLLLLN